MVVMEKHSTLQERLRDAMAEAQVNQSRLAEACGVSHVAVSKWLNGGTQTLSADNYANAARALGVRDEWLRTGKLPRVRDHLEEEREMDRFMDALDGMRDHLAAALQAIDAMRELRTQSRKSQKRG